ncbi:hypothetical protein NDU88_001481 [Pleurodeles waltl]|uniref:Reverse transcriptase domain-containing protein n=1 Tax=Pleurodeles waltl TaxID=8319 RepID=A0AAV7S8R2_PLEWA|nr:hypothetical protein NDU88_001481 [Pleurodeles waltl]
MDSVTELEGGKALVVDGSWAGEPVRMINVYAPSDECQRRELFQRLRPQLVTSRTIVMGGDFNYILESGGRCGTRAGKGWMDDGAKLLAEMVELLAEYIRKNPNIRGITTPGDAKKEVKCTLYMDDVTLFCTDGKSVQSLLEACKDFGKASGAKINMDKSQAKLFGRLDLYNKTLPFPIEAGLVKILSIWFGGPGVALKSWNECLCKVMQKLGFWSLRHLNIEEKALVLTNDALPVLKYVTQAWPLLANVARAVNNMVFHFVWHSKMERVKRSVMHKEHREGGKAVPDIPTILRAFFVCGYIRITLLNEKKDHSAYRAIRFLLLPVWRRLGWDKWENATMLNWDLPWYYKETEKFVVEFGLNCVTPSLQKPRTIHRLIRSRDTTEPLSDLPPATATQVWENVSSLSLANKHKVIAWMAMKGGLPVRSFMHSRGLYRHRECPRGCPAEETTYFQEHIQWRLSKDAGESSAAVRTSSFMPEPDW